MVTAKAETGQMLMLANGHGYSVVDDTGSIVMFETRKSFTSDGPEQEQAQELVRRWNLVAQLKALQPGEILAGVQDEGPVGEGWKSDDLMRLIGLLECL